MMMYDDLVQQQYLQEYAGMQYRSSTWYILVVCVPLPLATIACPHAHLLRGLFGLSSTW